MGRQLKPSSAAGCTIVTVPPVDVESNGYASGDDAIGPVIRICELVSGVEPEITIETVAATPLPIEVLLSPHKTQVVDPVLESHETVFPGASGPAATATEEKSTTG